jgi:cytochrome b561
MVYIVAEVLWPIVTLAVVFYSTIVTFKHWRHYVPAIVGIVAYFTGCVMYRNEYFSGTQAQLVCALGFLIWFLAVAEVFDRFIQARRRLQVAA